MTLVSVCKCSTLAEQLVHMGYWPNRPSDPSYAFSLQLFKLYRLLNLHGALSMNAFLQTYIGTVRSNARLCPHSK